MKKVEVTKLTGTLERNQCQRETERENAFDCSLYEECKHIAGLIAFGKSCNWIENGTRASRESKQSVRLILINEFIKYTWILSFQHSRRHCLFNMFFSSCFFFVSFVCFFLIYTVKMRGKTKPSAHTVMHTHAHIHHHKCTACATIQFIHDQTTTAAHGKVNPFTQPVYLSEMRGSEIILYKLIN